MSWEAKLMLIGVGLGALVTVGVAYLVARIATRDARRIIEDSGR